MVTDPMKRKPQRGFEELERRQLLAAIAEGDTETTRESELPSSASVDDVPKPTTEYYFIPLLETTLPQQTFLSPPATDIVIVEETSELELLSRVEEDIVDRPRGFGRVLPSDWEFAIIDEDDIEALARASRQHAPQPTAREPHAALRNWSLFVTTTNVGIEATDASFVVSDGTPISGDFDGDSVTDVGFYLAGDWLLDMNHNGRWDSNDLHVRLGGEHDQPVVGDWNGDGQDDLAVYGPRELSQLHSGVTFRQPNVDAAQIERVTANSMTSLSRRRARYSTQKVDDRIPVAGDWNGDGADEIALFERGRWRFDSDGDGQFTDDDEVAFFGEFGDVPIAGDFDADGIDEIAVVRAGRWLTDTNGNHKLDAHDRVLELDQYADLPLVGDWDGDGRDDVSVLPKPSGDIPHVAAGETAPTR